VALGCIPEGSPPWLVDHPVAAAMRIDVVERGPYGAASPRPDRVVAQVMPGDTIRATPFLVGPDGPIDVAEVGPAWFYCRATRCFGDLLSPEPPRDCAVEAVGSTETCRVGEGASVELRLGELTRFLDLFDDPPAFYMVSGTPDGPSTGECVARLGRLVEAGETLQRCLLVIKPLPLGPLWRLMLLAAVNELPDAVPLTYVPPAAVTAQPDLYPGLLPFELEITEADGATRRQIAATGDTVQLGRGARVEAFAPVDPFDAQIYYDALLSGDGAPLLQPQIESFGSSWLFSSFVDFDESDPRPQRTVWIVPEDAPAVLHGYYLLSDQRSLVWGWLRFEVAAP
jgi:hypothetical protein